MVTTPIFPPPTEAGFTLIEMLVVMTILAMVAGFAVSARSSGPDRFGREQAALKMEAAIGRAAAEARATGKAVAFHPARTVPGAEPADAVFGPAGSLILYPDGSASGGHIDLDGTPLLSVDWLTGGIARGE